MLPLTARWHKTLSSDTQNPLWSAKIMAAENETALFSVIFTDLVWWTKYLFGCGSYKTGCSFNKKNQASDEEARRRFFPLIFGTLWVTFNFNLIFLSDLMKKYHSFQFPGYILMLTYTYHHTTCHVSQKYQGNGLAISLKKQFYQLGLSIAKETGNRF